ncbi:PREDICTED: dimethylaniline monooxygenase [N-oxide-forming] 5-like [Chrysochloris asiatica]|uniref:Flavin-containing monooxygenase n=1 Tax=Chrysochloris asiatica TaxID=185453 RepID=A0A9B0X2F2_CHRAS|nr:PREDICTED: dimethylaniline monooxygenase [N-oxide-forming] 5-like [Chrysochloris asiatica]
MGVKRIAVIGAGVSGLSAIKSCLEEGLEPICFEDSNDIGGIWRYEENPKGHKARMYKSVICNTSKEMTAYSDYPAPDDYPNYLHNSKMMEYVRMYARQFNLNKYIRFLSKVCSVKKHSDFPSTGQWDVLVETEGKQETHVFDGVMVCSGHYTDSVLPLQFFPGIKRFRGSYFHSCDYRTPEKFVDKRVLVIGIGNSGADIACELGHMAKQVFISTRQGAWIRNRVWDNGYPMDVALFTRFKSIRDDFLPTFLINQWSENKLNAKFNHDTYGLQSQHRFLSQRATFSDELPNCIISGRVLVKPNVREFTQMSAIFEDGTEEDVDVVIFATGYKYSFPFLENDETVLDGQHSMFKFVFPPQLEKPTLAFIGILQPEGAIIPTSELQSRWVVRIFKGLNKLPSMNDMLADIKQKRNKLDKEYVKSPRVARNVAFVKYMDEIASEIGVKPNLLSLFFSDPKLALEVLFGPCTPYQYRLQGPGKWHKAREAILTQRARIIKPLRTRILSCDQPPSFVSLWLKRICAALLLFVFSLLVLKG